MSTAEGSKSRTPRRYTPEQKAQAVRLVRQLRAELATSHGTVQRVASPRFVHGSIRQTLTMG
jgi:transposase